MFVFVVTPKAVLNDHTVNSENTIDTIESLLLHDKNAMEK